MEKKEVVEKISQLAIELIPKLNLEKEESIIVLANIKDSKGDNNLTSLAHGKIFDVATMIVYLIKDNPDLEKLFRDIFKNNINKKNKRNGRD
jgi:hypothetical protein